MDSDFLISLGLVTLTNCNQAEVTPAMLVKAVRIVKKWPDESFFDFQSLFPRFKPLQNLDFTVVEVPDPLMSYGRPEVGLPVIPVDPVVEPRESREYHTIGVELKIRDQSILDLLRK